MNVEVINQVLVWATMLITNVVFFSIVYKKGNEIWNDLKGSDGKYDTKEVLQVVSIILIIPACELVMFLNQQYNPQIFVTLISMSGIAIGGKLLDKKLSNNEKKDS